MSPVFAVRRLHPRTRHPSAPGTTWVRRRLVRHDPAACLLALSAPGRAAESAPVQSARLTATLITDTDAVAAGKPFQLGAAAAHGAGLAHLLAEPRRRRRAARSDADLAGRDRPPGPIAWPTPLRLPEGPVMTYAYTGEVVLPITVTPGAGGADDQGERELAGLRARSACRRRAASPSTCRPGTAAASAQAPLFAARRSRLPRPSPFAAQIAPDGTLSLPGAGLVAGDGAGRLVLSGGRAGVIDQAAAQPVTVHDGVVRIALKPSAAASRADAARRAWWCCGTPGARRASWRSVPRRARRPRRTRRAAAAGADAAAGVAGRAAAQPDAVRVPGAGDEGDGAGAAVRPGERRDRGRQAVAYTAGVLLAFAALGRRVAGGARGGRCGGVGVPVPVAGVRGGDGLAAVRGRAEPVRRVRDRRRGWPGPGRAGSAGRARGQLLHRAAGGAGGDAVHGAVHGRGDRGGAGRAGLGDGAGVRGDGARDGAALPAAGAVPGLGAACCRGRDAGWTCCAACWRSRCMARRRGWSGCSACRRGRPACWRRWRRAWCCSAFGAWAFGLAQHGGRWRRSGQRGGAGVACSAAAACCVGIEAGAGRSASAAEAARELHAGPAGRAAGRGTAGLRQHDRGLVRDLPGQRAHRPVARAGAAGLRRPPGRLSEGRLDRGRPRHHRLPARQRAAMACRSTCSIRRARRSRWCCRRS